MADIKVLYINADGLPQEHSEATDSIKMASLKTANYELTDSKLGNLIGGAVDGSSEHHHDGRYFQESEHLNTSAGAGDAGKPIKLNASGLVDSSMLDFTGVDHGSISGLADDDHTQYILVDGTRDFSGIVEYATHPSFTIDTQLVDKKYVDDLHVGDEWHPKSAKDYIVDNTLAPPTEVLGDVYVLSHDGGAPNAAYDGASAGDIVEFNGTLWVATTPTTGTKLSVDDETTSVRLWNGTLWQQQFYESTTASTGLTKVGVDVRLADAAASNGIQVSSGAISAVVDGSSIGINGSNQLYVPLDGINDTHIDFGTGANQVSGADIPLADAGGYFTTDDVESALQQLGKEIDEIGVDYTVGAGGCSAGDALYISANNTASVLSTITNADRVIGLALTTESAAASVKVLANDSIVTGVLTAAVAGDTYYWNGSALSTTIPAGAGSHVWKAGVAKNATDLHVEVEFVKKNA